MRRTAVYAYVVLSLVYIVWLHTELHKRATRFVFGNVSVQVDSVPSTPEGKPLPGYSRALCAYEGSRRFMIMAMDTSDKLSRLYMKGARSTSSASVPLWFNKGSPLRDLYYGEIPDINGATVIPVAQAEAYRDLDFDGVFDVSIVSSSEKGARMPFIRDRDNTWLGCQRIVEVNGVERAIADGNTYVFVDRSWIREGTSNDPQRADRGDSGAGTKR